MQQERYTSIISGTLKSAMVLLACLLCGLMASAPLHAQVLSQDSSGCKTVVVQGVGAGGDKAKARDEAIQDAQRRAVEEGVGLYLKSDTIVANLQLIDDKIYRHVSGFVHTYTILDENYNATKDLYWVKIQAEVRTGQIGDDLDDLWDRLKVPGNPRIIIAVDPPSPDDTTNIAQNTLTEKLVNLGFKVLDARQLDEARTKQALKMIRDGQVDEASIMALQDRADVVITGACLYQRPASVPGDNASLSCQASLTANAVNIDTGQIIAATHGSGLAAGFSSQENVIANAQASAAGDWVKKNLGLLVRSVSDPCHEYELDLTGCTSDEVDAIDTGLADSRFVRQSELISFDKGYAQMNVYYQGSIKMLKKDIGAIKSVHIDIESVQHNKIRARVSG